MLSHVSMISKTEIQFKKQCKKETEMHRIMAKHNEHIQSHIPSLKIIVLR